jgi:hypothetical protein
VIIEPGMAGMIFPEPDHGRRIVFKYFVKTERITISIHRQRTTAGRIDPIPIIFPAEKSIGFNGFLIASVIVISIPAR